MSNSELYLKSIAASLLSIAEKNFNNTNQSKRHLDEALASFNQASNQKPEVDYPVAVSIMDDKLALKPKVSPDNDVIKDIIDREITFVNSYRCMVKLDKSIITALMLYRILTMRQLVSIPVRNLKRITGIGGMKYHDIVQWLLQFGLSPACYVPPVLVNPNNRYMLMIDVDKAHVFYHNRNGGSPDANFDGLGLRTINCLRAGDVNMIIDLVVQTEDSLLKFVNLGPKMVDEINIFLGKMNLSLGMTVK